MIYVLVFLLLAAAAFFIYRESSGYDIVEYTISTCKDLPAPVRFVMLSDLHDTDVSHDCNKGLLESVRKADPDFVILSGDMITSYMQPKYDSDVSFAFLKELSENFKVYYGLGNHEQRYKEEPDRFPGKYEELEKYVKSCGINLLSDTYSDVEDKNIRIYGYDIPIEKYKRAVRTTLPEGILRDVFGRVDEGRYNILLAHTPDFFEEYVRFAPDLVLSGHLHGGIVGIPGIGGLLSPQLKLFPKYDYGKFTKDNTTMIVSRGIGWHSVPIRIFNKAEIVIVAIEPKRGDNNGDQC